MAQLLMGAAPVMDKLARTEEWERYCTYLQGIAERFKKQKAAAQQALEDPGLKDEEVRKLRIDVFEANVWMNAMQFAVDLPAAILAGREEAEQFIRRFEAPSGSPVEAKP